MFVGYSCLRIKITVDLVGGPYFSAELVRDLAEPSALFELQRALLVVWMIYYFDWPWYLWIHLPYYQIMNGHSGQGRRIELFSYFTVSLLNSKFNIYFIWNSDSGISAIETHRGGVLSPYFVLITTAVKCCHRRVMRDLLCYELVIWGHQLIGLSKKRVERLVWST